MRYAGATSKRPEARWAGGYGYRSNPRFFEAIRRLGWANIRHEILGSGLSRAEAEELERSVIAEYDLTNPEKGYNRAKGGFLNEGVHPSEETRQKIRMAHLGKKAAEETKQHMSEVQKKRLEDPAALEKLRAAKHAHPKYFSMQEREKIRAAKGGKMVRDLDRGGCYLSARHAQLMTGIDEACIRKACKGQQKTAGGSHWAYLDDLQEGRYSLVPALRDGGRERVPWYWGVRYLRKYHAEHYLDEHGRPKWDADARWIPVDQRSRAGIYDPEEQGSRLADGQAAG